MLFIGPYCDQTKELTRLYAQGQATHLEVCGTATCKTQTIFVNTQKLNDHESTFRP